MTSSFLRKRLKKIGILNLQKCKVITNIGNKNSPNNCRIIAKIFYKIIILHHKSISKFAVLGQLLGFYISA
jgi:hypothetical protein